MVSSWARRPTQQHASSIKHEEGSGASSALSAVYAFSRPHTMIGTTLSVVSISLLALGGAQVGSTTFTHATVPRHPPTPAFLLACACMRHLKP